MLCNSVESVNNQIEYLDFWAIINKLNLATTAQYTPPFLFLEWAVSLDTFTAKCKRVVMDYITWQIYVGYNSEDKNFGGAKNGDFSKIPKFRTPY